MRAAPLQAGGLKAENRAQPGTLRQITQGQHAGMVTPLFHDENPFAGQIDQLLRLRQIGGQRLFTKNRASTPQQLQQYGMVQQGRYRHHATGHGWQLIKRSDDQVGANRVGLGLIDCVRFDHGNPAAQRFEVAQDMPPPATTTD